jgi:hypothetical protein
MPVALTEDASQRQHRKENWTVPDTNATDVISHVLLAGQRGVLNEAEQPGSSTC